MKDNTSENPEIELFQTYIRVWEGIHRLHHDQWQKNDLTMPQVKALVSIDHGVDTARDLAIRLGVSPPVITGIVDRLVARRLVTRTRSPDDRRVIRLRLTPQGKKQVRRLYNVSESLMRELFSRLDDEEKAALLKGFAALERELAAAAVRDGQPSKQS